jgi:hypothetical protein
MIELFKVFRLGIVSLLGVTIPGLLVLFFTVYGLAPGTPPSWWDA